MSDVGNGTTRMLLQITLGIIVSVSAFASGSAIREVIALKESVAEIKASRFKASDGLLVWQEIAKIRVELAEKASKADIPTAETLRRLDASERQIEELRKRYGQ